MVFNFIFIGFLCVQLNVCFQNLCIFLVLFLWLIFLFVLSYAIIITIIILLLLLVLDACLYSDETGKSMGLADWGSAEDLGGDGEEKLYQNIYFKKY